MKKMGEVISFFLSGLSAWTVKAPLAEVNGHPGTHELSRRHPAQVPARLFFAVLTLALSGIADRSDAAWISRGVRWPIQTNTPPIVRFARDSTENKPLGKSLAVQPDMKSKVLAAEEGFQLLGTTQTQNESEATPEIEVLARALWYDAATIYDYVRNHIDYVPAYGIRNGATGCLLAGRGGDWDQAALMVSLLRVSGYNTRFRTGQVVYYIDDLKDWLGVDTWEAVYLVLQRGGNLVEWYDASSFIIRRIWVEIELAPDYWFVMDPAFKKYTEIEGISLTNAMGYSRTELLNGARVGATVTADYARNMNETNIRQTLTAYTTNLLQYIQTNSPNEKTAEVIGGREIIYDNTLDGYLPEAVGWVESSLQEMDHVDPTNNITLRIKHRGIDHAFKGYELAGKRLSLFYDESDGYKPKLRVDGALVATGTATAVGSTNDVLLEVDPPYLTTDRIASNTLPLICGGRYLIIHDFENISEEFVARHNNALRRDIAWSFAANSEEIIAGGMQVTAASGLQQWHLSMELLSRLTDVRAQIEFFVGIMGLNDEGYYVDLPLLLTAQTPRNADKVEEDNYFKAWTMMTSALEHGVLEQSQGATQACASTVKLLQISNSEGRKTLLANSNNWLGTVKGSLVGYSTSEKQVIENAILHDGHSFLLPENRDITLLNWEGLGYVEVFTGETVADDSLMGMYIEGGLNGGYTGDDWDFSLSTSQNNVGEVHTQLPYKNTVITATDEPVDLHTGNYLLDHTDLSAGGEEPGGIRFARSYNSGQNYNKGPLGYGWTHNYDISAREVSNGKPGFGRRQAKDAAPLVVQSLVTWDLLQNNPDVDEWMTALLATKWGMDQLIGNSVAIQKGGKSLEYIRMPDGSYNPPPGETAALTKENDHFVLRERFGTTFTFNTNGQIGSWADVDSNSLNFAYNAQGQLSKITNNYNQSFTLTYNNGLVSSVQDDTSGRSISYNYLNGDLVEYVDPELNSWTYEYDSSSNHHLTILRDPLSQLTASNRYDAAGMVRSQMNGKGDTWIFCITGASGVEIDPEFVATSDYFDEDGRNVRHLDAFGYATDREYDGQGHLVGISDANGNETGYAYDGDHNLTLQLDPLFNITQYFYDDRHRLTSVSDPLDHVTRYEYDARHHLTRMIDPLSNETVRTYYPDGLLHTRTDANNHTTTWTYDSYGFPRTARYPDGGTNTLTCNNAGDLLEAEDPNGHVTTFTYDKRRLQTSERDAMGYVVSNSYDPRGLLIWTRDREGNNTSNIYTRTEQIERVIYPDGATVSNAYDAVDRLVLIRDPLGRVTSNRYDIARRVIGMTDPLGNETTFVYDPNGNRVSLRDAAGNTASNVFDKLNRVVTVIDPLGNISSNEYDNLGRVTATIDAQGKRTEMVYDALGFVKRNVYDTAGNLIRTVDANGETNLYFYNAVNLLTNRQTRTENCSYRYSPNRLLTNMVDSLGTTQQRFDNRGRLAWHQDPFGKTVSNTYDLAGNRVAVRLPDGKVISSAYDKLNRCTNVTDWFGRSVGAGFNNVGDMTTRSYPNGGSGAFTPDANHRLTAFSYSKSGSPFISRVITRNALGFKATENFVAGPEPAAISTRQYHAHNAADQIAHVSRLDGYAYPEPWRDVFPTFDANGNMTQVVATVTGQVTTARFYYDANNRLTNCQSASENRQFAYDGLGRRVKLTTNGVTHILVLDGADPLARPLMVTDGASTPLRWYVWANGRIMSHADTNGTTRYYHYDELGSTVSLTDINGVVTDSVAYSPFGRVLNRTGGTDTPFLWLGGHGVQSDGFAGMPGGSLYYMRHREYSADMARFLQVDPLGISGGLNFYIYGSDNPLAFLDPFGLCPDGRIRNETSEGTFWRASFENQVRQANEYFARYDSGPSQPVSLAYDPIFFAAGIIASRVTQPMAQIANQAIKTTTALSPYRVTAPGETFIRYESGNSAFTKITPTGGVKPNTFAAPASDGLVPVAERVPTYNLWSPEIPRPNAITLTPPAGTPIIGPRPVAGGTGNEVLFWMGY